MEEFYVIAPALAKDKAKKRFAHLLVARNPAAAIFTGRRIRCVLS